ncbi:MAG: hypothetical protein ABIP51_05290 [Bacteroidia bacterium]
MKKFLIPVALFTLIFSSCKTSQLESYQDDVYTSPTEERRLAKIAAAEQAKKEAEQKQKQEEEALAQKAKDDANPYYQDPQYNSDDYYDYKYASQIRRFNNPVNGAGYYNNYYTNSYMYNNNPGCYGSSIYSSYNYWMPSNQFGNYSNGLSFSISSGNYYNSYNNYGGYNPYYSSYNPYYSNNYYNPYGCSYGNPYYNPYYNPYNPYGNAYAAGYNNGFNNGTNWGYYNSYDPNSSYSHTTYGPRGSNGGGNSNRQTSAGMLVPTEDNARAQFVNAVAAHQESIPVFTDVPHKVRTNSSPNTNFNNSGNQTISSEPNHVRGGSSTSENYPNTNTNNNSSSTSNENTGFWPKVFNGNQNSQPVKNTNSGSNHPIKNNNYESESTNPNSGSSNPVKIKNNNTTFENNSFENNSNNSNRSNNGSGNYNNNSGGNSGGGSSNPRGGSGGGSNHPR